MKMKNAKTVLVSIGIAAMCGIAQQALAQEDGLVGVDIRNIKKDIAQSINVDPGKIPSAVRVKANIATETCKVPEDILAQQETKGGANCVAKMTSPALNRLVDREIRGITKP
jgi:hypothetical protein